MVGSAKAFAAFTANVTSLAGVDSIVSLQSIEGAESFVASIARVRFFVFVNSHVPAVSLRIRGTSSALAGAKRTHPPFSNEANISDAMQVTQTKFKGSFFPIVAPLVQNN